MRMDWEGYYLDGRTAARQQVAIRLMRQGLQITTEDGVSFLWRYRDIRQTQGFYAGEQVRFEKGQGIPEVLLVSDTAFLSAMRRLAPELTGHFHDPARRRLRVALTLLAALGVVGVSAALYLWGIPAVGSLVASRVPVSWEEHLGQAVAEYLAPPRKRCADPGRARLLDEISAALTAHLTNNPYTFRVMVVNDPMVNALAAPGGYILVFRGLLERTRSPEELAGVLAHEYQHVLRRHATRALLQNVSSGLLVAAMTGDASGVMAFGLESARTLGALRYSRQNEEEADTEGMRMLIQAGIDPAGMLTVFEGLQQGEDRARALLQYLSTHPRTEERVERLKTLAAQSPANPVKLLPEHDWRDIRKVCSIGDRPLSQEKRGLPAAPPRPPQGAERLYFVPLGTFSSPSMQQLATYYRDKFNLAIETLAELPLEPAVIDSERRQLIAEELIRLMKHRYADLAGDPQAILIGITAQDMYIRDSTWRFAFSLRQEGRFAVVSSARMDPVNLGRQPDEALLHARLQKIISKNVGIMYYRLPQSTDRNSVLYGPILGLDDLDSIGKDF